MSFVLSIKKECIGRRALISTLNLNVWLRRHARTLHQFGISEAQRSCTAALTTQAAPAEAALVMSRRLFAYMAPLLQ
jgi:hypothetical protein